MSFLWLTEPSTAAMLLKYLVIGNIQKPLYYLIHIVVLEVWVVSYGRIITWLVPAEALRWVIAIRKNTFRSERYKDMAKIYKVWGL